MSWDDFARLLVSELPTLSVTSWWRSASRNLHVGGCPHSKHLNGEAIDVVYDWHPPELLFTAALAHNKGFRLIREPTHDHFERV